MYVAYGEPLAVEGPQLGPGGFKMWHALLHYLDGQCRAGSDDISLPAVAKTLEEHVAAVFLAAAFRRGVKTLIEDRRRSQAPYVRRAKEFLAENLNREVSVEELTTVTGVSSHSLFAGFRAIHGIGPAAYHRLERLKRAREDLLKVTGHRSCSRQRRGLRRFPSDRLPSAEKGASGHRE